MYHMVQFVMAIIDTTDIAAPIEVVWDLTVDVESWPGITPTVTRSVRLEPGPLGVGSRTRIHQPGQRPRVWTVEELDAPRRFAWFTDVGPWRLSAVHELAEVSGGTRNTLTLHIRGPGRRVVSVLMGPAIRLALYLENRSFKRSAEASGDVRHDGSRPGS
jgi:hypothetical protein